MGMRMLSLGYHGNRGAQSRCQQHQNQEESADGLSSGGAVDHALAAAVLDTRCSSRTDLTLSRIYSEHIVLPYKLCQPRGVTFEDFKIRSLKRFCSFRSQLIGDLLFCIKRKKQYTINPAPPPSNLGN